MNSIILTKAFFHNIPDNSYIQIIKPKEGKDDYQGMWHIIIFTSDRRRIRATSCGNDLQECVNEISTADMTLADLRPRRITKWDEKRVNEFEKLVKNDKKRVNEFEKLVKVDAKRIDTLIRKVWAEVNG